MIRSICGPSKFEKLGDSCRFKGDLLGIALLHIRGSQWNDYRSLCDAMEQAPDQKEKLKCSQQIEKLRRTTNLLERCTECTIAGYNSDVEDDIKFSGTCSYFTIEVPALLKDFAYVILQKAFRVEQGVSQQKNDLTTNFLAELLDAAVVNEREVKWNGATLVNGAAGWYLKNATPEQIFHVQQLLQVWCM